MLRKMCLVCWLALPVCVSFVGVGGAAAQGTPESREACTPDAVRLCSDFIPDVPKITKCMIAKYRELSEPCRLAMAHEHQRYRHRRSTRRAACGQGGSCR